MRNQLPDGARCSGNGDLVKALVALAREVGREIASPDEARALLLEGFPGRLVS